MKTVTEVKGLDFPLKLEQNARGRFRVTYGCQIRTGLDYAAAAHEFGECYFHALACAGKLDNDK